jgi:DNA-binding CsgD family transcriptional regulator
MFETTSMLAAALPLIGPAYRGPERRSRPAPVAQWLAAMLDEIDYGMLLLGDEGELLHANHAARRELDAGHPLQLAGGRLRAHDAADTARLLDALADAAHRSLRRLVTLRAGEARVSLAVIPLGHAATLLVLGKRHLSERISVQLFAKQHGLTPAEMRVLSGLCEGLDPRAVAELHQVGLATVRTQVASIRAKTGAENIRDLVCQVAVLPPIVSSLRHA